MLTRQSLLDKTEVAQRFSPNVKNLSHCVSTETIVVEEIARVGSHSLNIREPEQNRGNAQIILNNTKGM